MKRKKQYRLPRQYEEMGAYLRSLRDRANLTQRDVSNFLGYSSAQFVSNFERGLAIPPLKKLRKLQELYGASMDRILELAIESRRRILMRELAPSKRAGSERRV